MKKLLDDQKNLKALYELFVILSLFTAFHSYIFNLGWTRFLFGFLFIIHSIIFVTTMDFSLKYVNKTNKVGLLVVLNCITTLLFNVLLPDGGDTESSIRVFFGKISDPSFIKLCYQFLPYLFLLELVVFIWRMAYTLKICDDMKENAKKVENDDLLNR